MVFCGLALTAGSIRATVKGHFHNKENYQGRKGKTSWWLGRKTNAEEGKWFGQNGALDRVCTESSRTGVRVEAEKELRGLRSWDSWGMKTDVPASWTVQKLLYKCHERRGDWMLLKGDDARLGRHQRLQSWQRKKQSLRIGKEAILKWGQDILEDAGVLAAVGHVSYLGRRWSNWSCCRDASLDRYVAARCCHGNCNWGGQEGGDDWEGKEPRTVVAIDDGRGTAMIGSSVV